MSMLSGVEGPAAHTCGLGEKGNRVSARPAQLVSSGTFSLWWGRRSPSREGVSLRRQLQGLRCLGAGVSAAGCQTGASGAEWAVSWLKAGRHLHSAGVIRPSRDRLPWGAQRSWRSHRGGKRRSSSPGRALFALRLRMDKP